MSQTATASQVRGDSEAAQSGVAKNGAPQGGAAVRIGILAGGGRLPAMIADSVIARGGAVHIVGVMGEADAGIERFPHTWANWAQIGRMLAALREKGGGQMVIAGGVTRPDLFKLRPDLGFFRVLPQLVKMLAGGDDSVLTRVVKVFEHNGLKVRGAHEVAPDLIAQAGTLGAVELSAQARADAELGFAVRQALGPLDAGQAVVVADGVVLAIEGAEGTDAMLSRIKGLPGRNALAAPRGVLAKGPKPGQELRVDMPAIGSRTIDSLVDAGLAGVVVEAGVVLLLDREEAVRRADAAQCAIVAVAPPSPGATAARANPARSTNGAADARCIGRVQPSARDAADIERGLIAVARLGAIGAPGAGPSVVVSRAYILAIEAMEGTVAMLKRVGQLRQWGLGAKRRVGVLVHRLDGDGRIGLIAIEAALSEAAAQGLAGVAVAGTGAALEPWRDAGPMADGLGVFLVVCETGASVEGA